MDETAGFGSPGFLPLGVRRAQAAEERAEAQQARESARALAERVESRRAADLQMVVSEAEARGERVEPGGGGGWQGHGPQSRRCARIGASGRDARSARRTRAPRDAGPSSSASGGAPRRTGCGGAARPRTAPRRCSAPPRRRARRRCARPAAGDGSGSPSPGSSISAPKPSDFTHSMSDVQSPSVQCITQPSGSGRRGRSASSAACPGAARTRPSWWKNPGTCSSDAATAACRLTSTCWPRPVDRARAARRGCPVAASTPAW